jgi:SAM-dependent methyltransferase
MRSPGIKGSSSVFNQNMSYYDAIAGQYDKTLNSDHSNELIRLKVASTLTGLLPEGTVLDFGGGTGQDLPWLIKKGYRIIFCEPSFKMRARAKEWVESSPPGKRVIFLDDENSNFTHWQNKSAFSLKVDAVLANFAVVNCIPDIDGLFKSLSLVTAPGAHVLFLVLKSSLKDRWRSNRRETLLSIFSGATIRINTSFNNHRQIVYLHTDAKIKRAAAPFFDFISNIAMPAGSFTLIHLRRS